ncbi:hypothetical protein E2C01_007117 [Portunus trituberculatus]|uniref:Uncharacterized protein n=1 Tax=Portunus trituberculatus TaxID=210409 RepID=A0A5B7CZL7_PORTR|nr:hypothetical protein [Portunus trituberculatus]
MEFTMAGNPQVTLSTPRHATQAARASLLPAAWEREQWRRCARTLTRGSSNSESDPKEQTDRSLNLLTLMAAKLHSARPARFTAQQRHRAGGGAGEVAAAAAGTITRAVRGAVQGHAFIIQLASLDVSYKFQQPQWQQSDRLSVSLQAINTFPAGRHGLATPVTHSFRAPHVHYTLAPLRSAKCTWRAAAPLPCGRDR